MSGLLLNTRMMVLFMQKCKCGFEYDCGKSRRMEDGTWSIKQYPTVMYPYCPSCGARKKRYNEVPEKLDKLKWE